MSDGVVHKLERRLELSSVVAISISAMLGSGIFVLPGLAAKLTGPGIFLAYLAAGLCVLPAALSKAELATAMPTSGGTYVYIDRTFGPLGGTVAGLGLWLSLLLKSAFALMGFGAYLMVLADVNLKVTALALLVVVVFMNARGVRRVARMQVWVIGFALACLTGLVIAGSFQFEPARLDPLLPDGAGGFVAAVGFVFVSFAGVTKVAAIAEEIKRPERNLPLGILLSLGLVTFIYGSVALMLVGVLPQADLQSSLAPVYDLAMAVGPALGVPAAILGVLTMTSMANAGLLAASRFPFAMGREELLPPLLSRLHPKFLTPTWSILLSGAIMAVAIALLPIDKIAKLASAFMILIYGIENLAVLVLRETGVRWYKPTWRSPLYPGMQLFGIVSSLALLVVMGPLVMVAISSIAIPGVVLFFAYGRKRARRLGVVALRGRRRDLAPAASSTELARPRPARPVVSEVSLNREAAVVVALFGHERSPEMLVELGAALGAGQRIEVVYITDIPEQTTADALGEEDDKVASVRRRVLAMRDKEGLELEFEALLSRDVVETVHEITSRLHCEWLIKEWRGRQAEAFTVSNPLGWLKDHLPSNLAVYSDAGVRYIRRILVHTEPGTHDLLLARTADHLGRLHDAEVTFAHFVPRSASDDEAAAAKRYLDEVRKLCVWPSTSLVVRGKRQAEALGHATAAYDLLITAESPERNVVERFIGSTPDRITETAACSVLRLQSQGAQHHTGLEWEKAVFQPSDFDLAWPLVPDAVRARVRPASKEHLFSIIAHAFADTLPVDAARLEQALLHREHTQNTGLGDGVAVPHATLPELEKTVLGVFTLNEPLEYHSLDHKGVDVLFATVGPPGDRHAHIMLLAAIARMIVETPLPNELRLAVNSHAVVELIERHSRAAVEAENVRPPLVVAPFHQRRLEPPAAVAAVAQAGGGDPPVIEG